MCSGGEEKLIKISELAKICGTTTHTLRYYDSEGVLCADHVDAESGYRYYSLDAVERFKKITFYKEMGFSLDEIKEIFSMSAEDAQQKLFAKKNELSAKINKLNNNIAAIDTIVSASDRFYPKIKDIFSMPFENDENVIGKWELCGRVVDVSDIFGSLSDMIEEETDRELYFLPGGAPAWRYFWTKGVLYRIAPRYNLAIPNNYRIIIYKEENYMLLDYLYDRCVEKGESGVPLLYRQVDNKPYTEFDIRKNKDDTDRDFEADDAVVGEWEVCDYVPTVEQFEPNKRFTADEECYTKKLLFSPRGLCEKSVRHGKRNMKLLLRYTKGFVLNDKEATAEEYSIKEIAETAYLFVQHKSGDYFYGGAEPHLYVFKRKE